MKRKNRLLQWLRRPRGFGLALIYVLTAAAIASSITLSVVGINADKLLSVIAYVSFGLSALLLGYAVYTIVIYAPLLKQQIVNRLKKRKFTAKLLESYSFKTMVFAVVSFTVTVAFAAMNLVSAITYRLIWYGAFAAYYFALALFRGGVIIAAIKCDSKYAEDELKLKLIKWRIYLASGAFLIIVELAMAAAVTQMMMSKRPTQSGQIMAIVNAAYTFYKMTMAIINIVKARKQHDPIIRSLRNLNFADACMSIVSLTVLMLATFDDGNSQSMLFLKATIGFAACIALIVIAAIMIISATKRINALKGEDNNE